MCYASVRTTLVSDAAALAAVRVASEPAGEPQYGPDYFVQVIEQHAGLVYVAEARGSVVGYLSLQRAAHPAVVARNPIQLWQLYVARPFHGSGVAALLMSAALDHARRNQHDVLWLGVSEQNLRGMAFYRKQGFQVLGVHEVGSAAHAHPDVVMSCPVG